MGEVGLTTYVQEFVVYRSLRRVTRGETHGNREIYKTLGCSDVLVTVNTESQDVLNLFRRET